MRDRGGMRQKGTGCEWRVRVGGVQDDDNCRDTVVMRNVECASVFQKEIVIVCCVGGQMNEWMQGEEDNENDESRCMSKWESQSQIQLPLTLRVALPHYGLISESGSTLRPQCCCRSV
jgi:hypothetical protein